MTAAHDGQRVTALDGASGGPSPEQVTQVADTISRLTRSVERTRQHVLAAARHDVEWSSHLLLGALAKCGPIRASALAGVLDADPSTVSRQIAALVKDGLIERQADPEDGRASILVLTGRGRAVHADHLEVRNRHFARMLDGWSERDCRRFATLLARFTENYEDTQRILLAELDAKGRVAAGREGES